jgi:hypothetical protein
MESNDTGAPPEDETGRTDDRNELDDGSPVPDPEDDPASAEDVPEAD